MDNSKIDLIVESDNDNFEVDPHDHRKISLMSKEEHEAYKRVKKQQQLDRRE